MIRILVAMKEIRMVYLRILYEEAQQIVLKEALRLTQNKRERY